MYSTNLDTDVDEKFKSIFQQLSCCGGGSLEELIDFNDNFLTSKNETNTDLVEWHEIFRKDTI